MKKIGEKQSFMKEYCRSKIFSKLNHNMQEVLNDNVKIK